MKTPIIPITAGKAKVVYRLGAVDNLELVRIYERLRKQDWRARLNAYDVWHSAYVAGVRDALNAVAIAQEGAL